VSACMACAGLYAGAHLLISSAVKLTPPTPMDTVSLFKGALPACAPVHHTAAVRHRSARRTGPPRGADRGAMQSIHMNTQCSTDHPDVWQDGWHAHRHHCWQRCQGMAAARHHGRARPTAAADCTKILACRRVICRRRNKGGGAPHKQSQCQAQVRTAHRSAARRRPRCDAEHQHEHTVLHRPPRHTV